LSQLIGLGDRRRYLAKESLMSAFPNWHTFAVPQRRLATGCIPTGYEFLARAAQVSVIDFANFQDEFDLDKDKDFTAGDQPENHFNSVANAVQKKYPQLVYECISFDSGGKKVKFIDYISVPCTCRRTYALVDALVDVCDDRRWRDRRAPLFAPRHTNSTTAKGSGLGVAKQLMSGLGLILVDEL